MCITAACPNPISPDVWWCDDECWRRYLPHLEAAIRHALSSSGLTAMTSTLSFDLGTFASPAHPNGARYTLDLRAMKQRNAESEYAREIRVVECGGGSRHSHPWEEPTTKLQGTMVAMLKALGLKGETLHGMSALQGLCVDKEDLRLWLKSQVASVFLA
ncbi:unnamed protein product [Closterium sp. NIES-64]|nr:unnamed protein product [Closterium sp. NIES-64]